MPGSIKESLCAVSISWWTTDDRSDLPEFCCCHEVAKQPAEMLHTMLRRMKGSCCSPRTDSGPWHKTCLGQQRHPVRVQLEIHLRVSYLVYYLIKVWNDTVVLEWVLNLELWLTFIIFVPPDKAGEGGWGPRRCHENTGCSQRLHLWHGEDSGWGGCYSAGEAYMTVRTNDCQELGSRVTIKNCLAPPLCNDAQVFFMVRWMREYTS